jgi:ubiquinone biosynthesis protein
LLYFLERLSPIRQQAIFAAQLGLPSNVSRARRMLALFRLCPTLHKLGQVVAHDRRLSLDLRLRLQELETLVPTDSLVAIRPLLERELGQIAGLQIGRKAIAEAVSPSSCLSSGAGRRHTATTGCLEDSAAWGTGPVE